MLDASDMIASFADTVLRSTDGKKPRFSNWIGKDLNGAISLIDNASPGRLIELAAPKQGRVLDFGCGSGPHKAMLEKAGLTWTGLDYDASMDPTARNRTDTFDNIVIKYDGNTFPFDDDTFDAIWSFQSLEHVNSADDTFREISRVLNPDGTFFGSASFLEAYHARSTFCYTPYGFKVLCDRHGLILEKIHPSIDGLSLVLRHFFLMLGADESEYGDWKKMMKGGGAFFEALRKRAAATGDEKQLAEAMVQMCGHFYFVAKRL